MSGYSQVFPESPKLSGFRRHLRLVRNLLREEGGQDTLEFALVASWISIVSILALQAIGPQLVHIWLLIRFALSDLHTALF